MAKRVLGAFLATNDPIPGRRIQLTEADIRDLAEHLRPDDQLSANHDERVLIPTRIVLAELRRTPSGSLGLWVESEVDEETLVDFPERFGYSVGYGRELIAANPDSSLPLLQLVVDSENFTDEQLHGTVAALGAHFNVTAGWWLQYSELPPPVVILGLGIQFVASVPPAVLRGMLVDAIKGWLFKGRSGTPTEFRLNLRDETREISAFIRTSDPDVFGRAVELLREVLPQEGVAYEYEDDDQAYRKIR